MIRLLACGGRRYADRDRVWRCLDFLHERSGVSCLIDGACHLGGADLLAHEWAVAHGIPTERYPVAEYLDGPWPGAGNRRNERMLALSMPDRVLGFPGGNGTAHMCRIARATGITTVVLA